MTRDEIIDRYTKPLTSAAISIAPPEVLRQHMVEFANDMLASHAETPDVLALREAVDAMDIQANHDINFRCAFQAYVKGLNP